MILDKEEVEGIKKKFEYEDDVYQLAKSHESLRHKLEIIDHELGKFRKGEWE